MKAPNPAPTDIESILDGVPKPQVVEPVGVEEKRIAAKKQKEEERKRKKKALSSLELERRRKEKQASGELPPSAEELEKERKLQEAQLAMARERAHAHALKEYRDERRGDGSKLWKSSPTRSWRRSRTWSSWQQMRKKYGSIDDAVARIDGGPVAGRPALPGRRGPSGKSAARTPRRSARRRRIYPTRFREFVEEGDPTTLGIAREESSPAAGESDRGTFRTKGRWRRSEATDVPKRAGREASFADVREDGVVDVRPPFRPIFSRCSLAVGSRFFFRSVRLRSVKR